MCTTTSSRQKDLSSKRLWCTSYSLMRLYGMQGPILLMKLTGCNAKYWAHIMISQSVTLCKVTATAKARNDGGNLKAWWESHPDSLDRLSTVTERQTSGARMIWITHLGYEVLRKTTGWSINFSTSHKVFVAMNLAEYPQYLEHACLGDEMSEMRKSSQSLKR